MMHICCFTGHRDAPEEIAPILTEAIEQHIAEYGVTEFLISSYGNFDRLAFSFWIRELSSNISVKPVRVFSTFRLKVSS